VGTNLSKNFDAVAIVDADTVYARAVQLAEDSAAYAAIPNRAELTIADGMSIVLTFRLLRKPLRERVTGVDLMVELCKR
jgi:UDP-N-acetyl-D-mannosaminuronic acid transferase (WecB/TagA/CpsF family)